MLGRSRLSQTWQVVTYPYLLNSLVAHKFLYKFGLAAESENKGEENTEACLVLKSSVSRSFIEFKNVRKSCQSSHNCKCNAQHKNKLDTCHYWRSLRLLASALTLIATTVQSALQIRGQCWFTEKGSGISCLI
jgi:hypothetical protein